MVERRCSFPGDGWNRATDRGPNRTVGRANDSTVGRANDRKHRADDSANDRANECANDRVNDRTIGRDKDRANPGANDCANDRKNERAHVPANDRANVHAGDRSTAPVRWRACNTAAILAALFAGGGVVAAFGSGMYCTASGKGNRRQRQLAAPISRRPETTRLSRWKQSKQKMKIRTNTCTEL